MIIYNVTVKVDPSIVSEWVAWMQAEHIPAVMATGEFFDYRFCRLLEQDETDGVTFTVQYTCDDINHYRSYIERYAPALREASFRQFGDKFIAFRTLMEVVGAG